MALVVSTKGELYRNGYSKMVEEGSDKKKGRGNEPRTSPGETIQLSWFIVLLPLSKSIRGQHCSLLLTPQSPRGIHKSSGASGSPIRSRCPMQV